MELSKIDITRPLQYLRAGQFRCSPGWAHARACMDGDYEIILGLEDVLHLTINGQDVSIRPGDVCVIPPHMPYEGSQKETHDICFYWAHFMPRGKAFRCPAKDLLPELLPDQLSERLPANGRDNPYLYLPLLFHAPMPEKIYILMKQVLDVSNSAYYSGYCIDYLITALALEITEQYKNSCLAEKSLNLSGSSRLAPILEWIRVNMYKDLTVASVAEHFSFSPDYLTRLFKKHLGMGTNKYLNLQKINTVKGLLSTTNMTTKEIAYLLHFKDEKYLMRLFKNVEGITISKYRSAYTKTFLNNDEIDGKWNEIT